MKNMLQRIYGNLKPLQNDSNIKDKLFNRVRRRPAPGKKNLYKKSVEHINQFYYQMDQLADILRHADPMLYQEWRGRAEYYQWKKDAHFRPALKIYDALCRHHRNRHQFHILSYNIAIKPALVYFEEIEELLRGQERYLEQMRQEIGQLSVRQLRA